jgi:preprotein translocase subunit SecA
MGFWDWLKGKPKTVMVSDIIWMTPDAKFRGIGNELEESLAGASPILVVAHFAKTLAEIKQVCESRSLPHTVHNGPLPAATVRKGAEIRITLVLAESLTSDEYPEPGDADSTPIRIVVGERHFLPANDERIEWFAASLGGPCQLRVHSSLRDPIVRAFAGDWIEQMLGNLGMTESEPIESRMLSRRIRAAQATFAKRALGDSRADSAEKWVELNVPNG